MDKSTEKILAIEMVTKIKSLFLIIQTIFLVFFVAGDLIKVIGLQPGCGQVNRIILAIEMANEIWSLILMVQIFFQLFFSMEIKFKSCDCDQGVDRSTKKSWPLRWRTKYGH